MRAFNSVAKYSNVWNSNNHTFCKPRGTVEVIHISHLKHIYGITGVLKKSIKDINYEPAEKYVKTAQEHLQKSVQFILFL